MKKWINIILPNTLGKLGLFCNILGVCIIGWQKYWVGFGGTSPKPEIPWLYHLGWILIVGGF